MKICLFFLLTLCASAYGQLTKVCYDKNQKASDESMSDYCVVGKVVQLAAFPGSRDSVWHFVDTVQAYYTASKKIKFLKIYDADGLEDGNYIEYFADGKIKERGAWRKGRRAGLISVNYPSGKQNYTLQYFPADQVVTNYPGNFKIQSYFDENGMQVVKNGDGLCNCRIESSIREVGKVKNGVRDSIWSGYKGDTLAFMESYHEGKFIDGVSYYNDISFRYTKFEEQPSYQGGYEAMLKTIRLNMKFPASARRNGVDGTVLVSFIVTKEGGVEDVKVARGLNRDCDLEAVRVVQLLNKWNPGRQRGRPVNVRFNLPIKFKYN
jgi:TonB family protein